MKISIEELNALDQAAFVKVVGPVFEDSPWIAERTWRARPFADRETLHERLCATMRAASADERLALIQAHPDLVGRAAREGTLTPASTREQAGAGLSDLSAEEVAAFESYNGTYRGRFGFPFIICARENKKESILAAFPRRLGHSPDEEMTAALDEISKIAWFRIVDAVEDSTP